ncbi:GNAT family N-acetyltransferase [Rubrolithibacter danxiaensis]|uniref:GNAT family N-acetyltransferase n=1 Tax=Rubrolithibacter danxiaensis TaxID=3390805 RepID=UPI003BF7845D
MQIKIREAKKEDCSRLLELIRELAEYERAPQEVTVTLEEFETAGFGENPVWKAYVAEANTKIEGFALYYIRYSTWKGCRLYLEDFIVTEELRGRGIGKKLFEIMIAEAKEKGFNGMSWQVLDWNEPAINFYNKYEAAMEAGWLNASLSKEQLQDFDIPEYISNDRSI